MTNAEPFCLFETSTIITSGMASKTELKPMDIDSIRPILSAEVYIALITFLSYAIPAAAMIGIVSNIPVIVTCTKIGFSEPINISFLALGISNLMASIVRFWGAI
ncbi:hypothetical protein PoB_001913400 [Plakobranchus ocellatus]|uniref:Uncharacterized protein n=1 Tax=Plakobranchus ocellatus TaxID=259542 RepID=A0AAV3ZE08_9GAST|nr:hypothetical protein PoB_001913400 [Plakobranchus ocellatus]